MGRQETGTPETSIAREAANGITIRRASKNGHLAHSAPVWRPRVAGIVPINGRDASEIIVATVAVDLDSNPPLGALFTLVFFTSQVQLEARLSRSWKRSRRALSAEVRGGFPSPCPQPLSLFTIFDTTSDVRATRRPKNENDDHAESRIRIAIEIITTNKVLCPSNTSSQGALHARDHR